MKRFLLVTSKSPFLSDDFDGGSVLVSQLCHFLPKIVTLDVLFLRKTDNSMDGLSAINEFNFIEPEVFSECRFNNRILNAERTSMTLNDIHQIYEKIFVVHASNCFGIDRYPRSVSSKVVLFPMFTGASYIRSGEAVPYSYLLEELKTFQTIEQISSPSKVEAKQLASFYHVNSDKISIHPRGIDFDIYSACQRKAPHAQDEITIAYVATIKPQKNQIDTIQIIRELKKRGFKPVIHLVGGIGCLSYYRNFQNLIEKNEYKKNYVFHGIVTPKECCNIICQCHYGISVSKWETFGKSVFEGLATGLPTFAYENIECLWEYLPPDGGIKCLPCSPISIADAIDTSVSTPVLYKKMANQAAKDVSGFDLNVSIKKMLCELAT